MEQILSRQAASEAVSDLGWRLLLGTVRTSVRTDSLANGAELARTLVAVCGSDADQHLRLDLRPERLVVTLQSTRRAGTTDRDTELAERITAAVRAAGRDTSPEVGDGTLRSDQVVEIAIDAMDIAMVRPFWKAVLGYTDEVGAGGPEDALVDPVGQAPSVWFQQMDEPRAQRNRIHFDVCVPHDEAEHRLAATIAAGGRLISADRAPAFWVLADAESNEACVTTWQGRD